MQTLAWNSLVQSRNEQCPLPRRDTYTRWFKYDRDDLCVNKSSLSWSYLNHLVHYNPKSLSYDSLQCIYFRFSTSNPNQIGSHLTVPPSYWYSPNSPPKWGVHLIVGQSFLFPVDVTLLAVLSAMLPQLSPISCSPLNLHSPKFCFSTGKEWQSLT